MNNKLIAVFFIIFLIFFNTFSYGQEKEAKSWKDIRDYAIVKQEFDYSCGIASLATLLNNQYNLDLKEEDLINKLAQVKCVNLDELKKQEGYTLLDLKKIAENLGYKAKGYAIDFVSLQKLNLPVIVFIIPNQGNNHFSVIKKIDEKFIYLADPSWGNIKMIQEKFIQIWKTRNNPKYYGQILIISK